MGHDRLVGEDRLEQITQRVIDRRRDDGHEWLVDAAERLIDAAEQLLPETAPANGARGLSSSEPTVLKPSRRNVARVSGGQPHKAAIGNGASGCGFLTPRATRTHRFCEMRQRPGGAGRGGDRKPRR